MHSLLQCCCCHCHRYCSPTRSALQSGRNPYHVNPLNAEPEIHNPDDPVSGFAAIPRNITGIAAKLKSAGYKTAGFGKVVTVLNVTFCSADSYVCNVRSPEITSV